MVSAVVQFMKDWWLNYSPLCKEYLGKDHSCIRCPLHKEYGSCKTWGFSSMTYPNKNLWISVDDSKTWEEWIKNAEKFLRQLKRLE